MKKLLVLLGALTTAYAPTVFAWGGRGHDSICVAATFLVKSRELHDYLKNKPHMMGHLCNIPDIYWKSISVEDRKLGDPTHFIDAEKIGLKLSEIPSDYKKIIETFTGKPNKEDSSKTIYSVPEELGSNWWRADQFYRMAIEEGKKLKELPAPKNSKEEQDDNLPYNKAFYNMVVYMGLMGHFVGDNGQPFHTTSDYDGYGAGHGGIHAYYEDGVVSEFGPDLVAQIVKKAKSWKSQPFTEKANVIDNMRELGVVSANEVKDVYKLDPMISPSVIKVEHGMSLRTPAKRRSTEVAFKKMNKMIVKEMARSSYLLAYLWDKIYKEAGEPPVKGYKSYKYPFTPDFVKPDYF